MLLRKASVMCMKFRYAVGISDTRSSYRSEAERVWQINNTHHCRMERQKVTMCCVLFQFQFSIKLWS